MIHHWTDLVALGLAGIVFSGIFIWAMDQTRRRK